MYFLRRCQSNLHWDPSANLCGWPENVKCKMANINKGVIKVALSANSPKDGNENSNNNEDSETEDSDEETGDNEIETEDSGVVDDDEESEEEGEYDQDE